MIKFSKAYQLQLIYSRERIEYGLAPVHSYGGQCEHTHRDGKDVYKWTESAHERRQIPSLKQSGLKLKKYNKGKKHKLAILS